MMDSIVCTAKISFCRRFTIMVCSYKSYLLLFVFVVCTVVGRAYTPVTWINGTPNTLFAPPCLTEVHGEKKKCPPWQGHVRTNLFAVCQKDYLGFSPSYAGGIALQGHLHLDKILHNLYGEIYAPIVLAAEGKRYYWSLNFTSKKQSTYSSMATVADVPLLIGYTAIKRKRFQLDGYVLGIIPTVKRALFYQGTAVPHIRFDDHFSWGIGSSCLVHLWGRPQHNLGWLTEADITFHEGRNETNVFSVTTDGWKTVKKVPILLRRHADQLYMVQSNLAYKFKHLVSDLGVRYFHIPGIKYSLLDTTIITQPPMPWPALELFDAFSDIGWIMHLYKLPSYVTLGAHYQILKHDYLEAWGINLKFGVDF
jgi:hypothetical protein